jgi:hypothetical protein
MASSPKAEHLCRSLPTRRAVTLLFLEISTTQAWAPYSPAYTCVSTKPLENSEGP